jgi:glycosyltransferase involved in cell wall biosynthesis
MQDVAEGAAKALWALRRRKFAWFLRRIEGIYDLCFLNSQEDLDSLREAWPRAHLEVVANGLPLGDYPLHLAEPVPGRLIYPGSVTYPPNLDAVRFFAERILPLVRAAVPGVELQVTGAAPSGDARPAADGLVYTGYLPDVRRAIAAAWACVVPLRLGAGGARLKVLESLALGTPMVATAIGYEGVAITDGIDILAAETPEEFARQTIAVLGSPELRQRLSLAGRALVERRYDVERLGAHYRGLLHGLVAGPLGKTA